MNQEFLVGYTGFVGSNLAESHRFSGLFNSKNIADAFGGQPDLLVYAGVPAEMYLANQNPEADLQTILEAEANIQRIDARQVVLISTIAVYPNTHGADEDTIIAEDLLTPYGAHRRMLEAWVEEHCQNSLIARLPALYGINLKKNFIYDYLHIIPAMLTEAKIKELSAREPALLRYYEPQGNGFCKCRRLDRTEEAVLKGYFRELGFSALNFTDSRSKYQFYPLERLWGHIDLAMQNHLQRLNIVTEPVQVSELYKELSGEFFQNELNRQPFDYDLKSKYANLLGGSAGYLMSRDESIEAIREFVVRSKKCTRI